MRKIRVDWFDPIGDWEAGGEITVWHNNVPLSERDLIQAIVNQGEDIAGTYWQGTTVVVATDCSLEEVQYRRLFQPWEFVGVRKFVGTA
jgi:hypothetical protein